MLELVLKRIAKRKGYTIGRLYVKTHPQAPFPSEARLPVAFPVREGGSLADRYESLPSRGSEGNSGLTKCQSAQSDRSISPMLRTANLEGSFFCDTLEPTWRDYAHGEKKVKGCSAIPEGRYAVALTFSPKFQKWLPELIGVPNFSGIRIHAGNTAKDTQGCILVGQNLQVGKVLNSRVWLEKLKQKMEEARNKGEPVRITVM